MARVFRSDPTAVIRYIGMMMAWGGSIIVAITIMSDKLRPRNGSLAMAYAAGTLDKSISAVPAVA